MGTIKSPVQIYLSYFSDCHLIIKQCFRLICKLTYVRIFENFNFLSIYMRRTCIRYYMNISICWLQIVVLQVQAQQKQFRVGSAKIGWSAEGTSTVEGSGHAPPGNFEI